MKIKRALNILLATLLLTPFCALSQQSDNDRSRLSTQSIFSIGNNGFVGATGEGERLYLEILAREDSAAIFTAIITSKTSTLEGKLYAACGLKKKGTAPPLPENITGNTDNTVTTLKGDILRKERFDELYRSITLHGC